MSCRVRGHLGTFQSPLHKCLLASRLTKVPFPKLRKELELSLEEEETVAKNSFRGQPLCQEAPSEAQTESSLVQGHTKNFQTVNLTPPHSPAES